MTLFELEGSLPNGFHDAEVTTIVIDYRERVIRMEMDLWIGDMSRVDLREMYRRAELTISGFHYCAMDVPAEDYPYEDSPKLTIDLAKATAFASPGAAFNCRLWVNEWNGFIHLSATGASLRWLADPVDRR